MRLIIAEKPSLGRTIAQTVGASQKNDGYLEGNGYLVSWCFGHLYSLYDLEQYVDPNYKKGAKVSWTKSMQYLPFFPENWGFRYAPKENCIEQIRILRTLFNRQDVDVIYSAGDADREGEVIARLAIDANLKRERRDQVQILRLWMPSLTADGIRTAIRTAKPISEYELLYRAGRVRAAVDWMLGIELTRFASVKSGNFIRIGRCVCPIVTKIVEREKEIRDFVPVKYFAVEGKIQKGDAELKLLCKRKFEKDQSDDAKAYADLLNREHTIVTDVITKDVILKPGKLFSLSDLQSFICKKNKSLSPSDVLNTVQSLYEHGFVTYPRTNSSYLCEDEAGQVDKVISAFAKTGMNDLINKPGNTAIYDDSKVESHSALTPTEKIPSTLSGAEKTVYEAIRNRFFAVFCATSCIVERTQYTIECGSYEKFSARGDVVKQEGWQKYESSKKDANLPKLTKGEEVFPCYSPVEKETQPPKRFTVESLNKWMLSPFKKDEEQEHSEYTDEEWTDILSEATICTEATRASIIDNCIKTKYITLNKGVYAATDYGFYLVDVLGALGIDLSPAKTVELSRNLHDISVSKKTPLSVLEETKELLTGIIKDDAKTVREYNGEYAANPSGAKEELGVCPKCGSPVYETPKAFSCSNRECRFALWKDDKYFKAIGSSMTKARAKAILKNKKVLLKGLKSKKSGKTYDAYVILDGFSDKGYIYWKMEFANDNPSGKKGSGTP